MASEAKDDNKSFDDEEIKENYPQKIDFKALPDGSVHSPSYIILLGDSMLDNFYYQMDKKKQSMTSLLRSKYFNKAMITNLAVDGCESRHVLYGIEPQLMFINARKKHNIDPYPIDFDEGKRVYPLAILQEMIETKSINFNLPKCYLKPTIILSVGMMDIKSLIPIHDETSVFTQMLSFEKNLNQILQQLHKYNCNVILLSLWEPYSDFYNLYETPRDAFVMLLNVWMTKLFSMASDHNVPIIDLTRTIYTYDRSHFGESIFENSNKSSQFVIELIDFIFKNHNFAQSNASTIYYSSRAFGGIKFEKNDISAREKYVSVLKSQAVFKNIKQDYDFEEKKICVNDEKKVDVEVEKDMGDVGSDILKATHVILLGDSVLDNFYWLKDKKKDVKQQILDEYSNEIVVTNLAVDESTSEDVLYGVDPSWTYVDARKLYGLEAYPIDKDNNDKVVPLRIMKRMIDNKEIKLNVNKNEIKPTVLLSIGGNDVRVLLFDFDLQNIMSGLAKFEQNAQAIFEKILFDLNLNLIPVIVYEPYMDFAAGYGIKREQLLQIFNIGATKIFELCETYALPVMDLSRTFNPFNRKHYGSTSIEPSNQSGQFIVDLLRYINENFPFKSNVKTSKIYYGLKTDEKGIIQQENNKDARDGYLKQLLANKPPPVPANT